MTNDDLLPEGIQTYGVLIRCGCRSGYQVRNLHVTTTLLSLLRYASADPSAILLSWRCPGRCKQKLKVTVAMLQQAEAPLRQIR